MELKSIKKKFNRVLALVLTIVALTVGQNAWAASTFTVTNTSGTSKFVITRTSNTSTTETVKYRTVSLSAIAGMHFTEKVGELTFDASHNSREVEVTENTPGADAYKFQNGTSRKYRFEVLDQGGFRLAYTDRTITTGTSVPSSGAFSEKEITIYTDELQYSDAGYDKNTNNPQYINSSSYYNLSGIAPSAYYTLIGAQLRSTLSFDAREQQNGYQYVQILINNTSTCDNRKDCSDGNPGNMNISRYMAGFDHEPSKANTNYAAYTFPVTSQPDNNTNPVDNAWSNGVTNKLYKQKFNTNCRATDGRLILPVDFNTLVVRFNASGGSDEDKWWVKNVKAHIQAVDGTAPSRLGDPVVSGSMHAKGNTFYVSVPFDEIVIVSGTPTLSTTWGSASYVSSNGGSGSNVLTFSGTITASAGKALTVNSISGTIKDLAGNELSSAGKAINKNIGTTVDANHTFTITYDLADGTVATANPDNYTYETATFTLNNPIRTGYTFAGWTGSNGNTPQTTVTIPAGSHGDKTFTANWTAHTYKVRFNANGSTGEMSDQDFTYDVAQNLTANAFTRTGYTYNGWSATTDGTVVYTDGQEVLNLTATDGAVVDLYAHWTANTYNVTLDNQSATTAGTTSITATYDAAMPSITVPKRTGYTFRGYHTTANGSGTNYYNADGTSANKWNIASNTTLYAKLTANTYTVRFNANGGTGTMSDMAFTYDAAQDLTANAFARTGCTFAGWSTTADGSGDSYTDGQNVTNLTADNNDVVILYAQWTDHWGITDDADGSENKPYTITTPAGLDLLASDVNNGINEYGGKYFKLGNDIDYQPNTAWNDATSTEDNYTAIGNENKAFCGIFDGDSHTVSGIRIYKPNADYQGLFGRVWEGTVKNVTLTDARITGDDFIGGISGHINGNNSPTIQNCLVLNTAINGSFCGAVIGDVFSDANLITNYYYGCTVNGTAKAVNVGTDSGDRDGACSVHSLTLSTGVTATGKGVTIGTDTYYASNTTVTLNAPAGYAISSASYNDGADHDITDNTFTMPATDVTVTSDYIMTWASLKNAMQNGGTFTLPYDITATETDTYLYVRSDKTVTLDLNGHTINRNLTAAANDGHVIRVDGTLTINDSSDSNTGSITGGNSKNNCGGVYVWGALIMNGGNIISNTTTKPGGGVYVYHTGTFTMSGGTITGNNAEYGGGVYNDGTFNISGNPVITGNTNSTASKANNVYLTNGKVITVTGALTTGACIGVRMQDNTGVFTSGLNGNGTVANFTCDNSSECGVYLNGNGEASIIVDVWGIPDGADGSEAHPYNITTTRDLDLLATRVNSGMGYGADNEHPNGFFFQLGADITYIHKEANEEGADTEDNYTAIGASQNYCFRGTFDGKDHTISGIRIYKGESNFQGLFGYVIGGKVKNVTLSDAHITGKQDVGGIVGFLTYYDNGPISSINNCHVDGTVTIQAVVNSAESHGGIAGASKGSVSNCTSSVTFMDSNGLTGWREVGGIVGYARGGTISNCLAVGVTIPAVSSRGAIVGVNAGSTLTANYYLNCTVGGNTTNVGNGSVDPNGARSVHSLTLADGVTASGESVTIGSDTYYASNTNVSFTYNGSIPRGYVLDIKVKDANNNDIAVAYSNDTYTFKMPACDASVSGITDVWGITNNPAADGSEEHPYIITSTTGLDLLAKNVNGIDGYTADKFDGKFFKLGNDITYAHTTDWNDATSTENNYTSIGIVFGKEFWGTFDGDGHTISGIRIYKGNDNSQGLFGYARGTVKNVTLSDARITGKYYVGGIVGYLTDTNQLIGTVNNCHVDGNVAIHTVVSDADDHGGIVGCSGTVINCTSQAVLTVADNLTGCGNYGGIVGQNDGNVSNGTSSATIIVGNGVSGSHFGGIVGQNRGSVSSCLAIGATIPNVGSKGAIAGRNDTNNGGTLNTNYYYNCTIGDVSNATSVGVGTKDINNNNNPEGAVAATILSGSETVPSNLDGKVAFRREFTGGKASTVCLPFALTDIKGGKAYEFEDVTYDAVDGWVATMNEVTATVANKPYLFLPEGSGSVPVLFHGTAGYDVSGGLATTSGDWTFTGTYTNLTYGTEPMTGHIYGFASKSKTVDGHDVEAGQFVHAKEGASVPPMRCYLTYKNGAQRAPMRASALGAIGTDTEVPSRITVRLVSAGGTVTAVGTLDTVTGEIDIDTWYDMNGRLLETEPTAPGLYIHNGKTIMIKK